MEEVKSKQYIDVRLGKNLYGIEINYVYNIIVMQNITRVPKAQPYFDGVINLRGEIIPVMSLRTKLGLEKDEFTPTTRIMIIRPDPFAPSIGMIVDSVNEVVSLDTKDIDKITYDEQDKNSRFSEGIGKIGSELISILNISELVDNKEV